VLLFLCSMYSHASLPDSSSDQLHTASLPPPLVLASSSCLSYNCLFAPFILEKPLPLTIQAFPLPH
jgi:hypothetical protein